LSLRIDDAIEVIGHLGIEKIASTDTFYACLTEVRYIEESYSLANCSVLGENS
jgi:hypothetical protein